MFTYLVIFVFKIIDDALATIRLIVVNNGRKLLGGVLQLITTIIWVLLTGYVLTDFMKDIYKVIAFSLGSFFGSYVGCFIEEKIGMGTNSFIIKSSKCVIIKRFMTINNIRFIDINNDILMLVFPKKKRSEMLKLIYHIDNKAYIICEKIKLF